MINHVVELMRKGEDKLSAEELALLELMSVLVERFEEEHYPIPDSPPHRILQHLMDSRNAKQADLVPIIPLRRNRYWNFHCGMIASAPTNRRT